MLTKLQQDALWNISRDLLKLHGETGGDAPLHELYDRAVQQHRMSHEEAEELDVLLIKGNAQYKGRNRV